MKKRTLIGAVCIAAALILTFILTPLLSRAAEGTSDVPRLKRDISRGEMIAAQDLEYAKLRTASLPSGTISDAGKIAGMYAASDLYAGDTLTARKLSDGEIPGGLSAIGEGRYAVSVTVDSFAAGLAGKLRAGDIVCVAFRDRSDSETVMPPELRYVKVLAATSPTGAEAGEDAGGGKTAQAAAVTLLARPEQAKLLADMEKGDIHFLLVFRGDEKTAKMYLDEQDAFLDSMNEEDPEESGV